jgi:hypothetical protein
LATKTRSEVSAARVVDVVGPVEVAAAEAGGPESVVVVAALSTEIAEVDTSVLGTVVVVDAFGETLMADDTTSSGTSCGRPVTAIPASSEITATAARSRIDLTAASR